MNHLFYFKMLKSIPTLFIFFVLSTFCLSMEAQEEYGDAFGSMKSRLSEELTAYTAYVEDACEYYSDIIGDFQLFSENQESVPNKNLRLKEKILLKKLDKLSIYDKDFVLDEYRKIKKEEHNLLRSLLLWSTTMQAIFIKRQNIVKSFLPELQKALEILDKNNVDSLFLGLLTSHGIYSRSRTNVLRTDPSPVFSATGVHDNFHDQRKIAIEETRHGIVIDFLDLLYPFIHDSQGFISRLLAYLPVLSKHVSTPQKNFSLDEYVLDGFILDKHISVEDIQDICLGSTEVHETFVRATSIPIIDIYSLKVIQDPTFAAETIEWTSLYKSRFAEILPSKTFPADYLKGLNAPSKKKKKRHKRKKNNRIISGIAQKNGAIAGNSQKIQEILPHHIPEPYSSEKSSTLPPAEDIPLVHATQPLTTNEEPENTEKEEIPLQINFSQKKEELKRRAKIAKDLRKERKSVSLEGMTQEPAHDPHPPLSPDSRFKLKGEDYGLLTALLTRNLPPTTSYNKIVNALKRLDINFVSRGNGDKRIMIMPNGRKELVFYPATAEVGRHFLEKTRKALQEKWGLTPEHLS